MIWYKIKTNVIELMEFLMDGELIVTPSDVIDLNDNPWNYDEVWKLYQKEILGYGYGDYRRYGNY